MNQIEGQEVDNILQNLSNFFLRLFDKQSDEQVTIISFTLQNYFVGGDGDEHEIFVHISPARWPLHFSFSFNHSLLYRLIVLPLIRVLHRFCPKNTTFSQFLID